VSSVGVEEPGTKTIYYLPATVPAGDPGTPPPVRVGDTIWTPGLLTGNLIMPRVLSADADTFRITVTPETADLQSSADLWYGEAPRAVPVTLHLRAYLGGEPGRKRWRTVRLDVHTIGASYAVSVATDGQAETTALAPETVAPRRGYNQDGSRWTTSNAGDDHGAAGREDYAVVCPIQCGSGFVLNREQTSTESFSAGVRGRTVQPRVTSTRGSLCVQAVTVEGTLIDRHLAQTT
jgi:hypothetical protein